MGQIEAGRGGMRREFLVAAREEYENILSNPIVNPARRVEIEPLLDKLSQNPAIRAALALLENLPTDLRYHTIDHTYDVLTDAVTFALLDGLSDRDIELVAIAAAFHDTGFVKQRSMNEPIGAQYAREEMQLHKYTEEEILLVEGMVLDTQLKRTPDGFLKQIPTTRLSAYVLDADLANFGKTTFFAQSVLVLEEMLNRGIKDISSIELRNYLMNTDRLVSRHQWYTHSAKLLFERQKMVNADRLAEAVAVLDVFTRATAA